MADKPIQLALLIPTTGSWNAGARTAGAAQLAIEQVNADKALLPGRVLEYSWKDSGCSAKQGLAVMGELLSAADQGAFSAVIGPYATGDSYRPYATGDSYMPYTTGHSYRPYTTGAVAQHAR